MLIKYWANATESGLPLMVMVRSVLPPSRSSQFEMRIMAPEIWRISAILVPPLPIMQPIKSFETVISCCCCCARFALAVRNCEPARAARAGEEQTTESKHTLVKNSIANVLHTHLCDLYPRCWLASSRPGPRQPDWPMGSWRPAETHTHTNFKLTNRSHWYHIGYIIIVILIMFLRDIERERDWEVYSERVRER